MNTWTNPPATQQAVKASGTELWVEQRGDGSDVLLLSGLGDPHEAWEAQLDGLSERYRLTAPDNRGVGRSPMPAESHQPFQESPGEFNRIVEAFWREVESAGG